MSESKDSPSFFRKMVKFVANPATEWAELTAPSDQARETESAKTELKAMIERKRRNDFVRKRELDMLRRVRREGLSSEQLAALGGSSRIDDSEVRPTDSLARADGGVKAKIDQIEQQMVGDSYAGAQRRAPDFYSAPTQPASIDAATPAAAAATAANQVGGRVSGFLPTRPSRDVPAQRSGAGDAPAAPPPKLEPLTPALDKGFSVEVSDVVHDPDLDEAVIAFANADFEQCEHALAALTGTAGKRAQHAETWLVLFDLYRAIGQQHKFESLALDYAQQFGWSAPQWYSMPRMVAEATTDERPRTSRIVGQVGWVCPAYVDADEVAKLSSQSLQMPLPWVFDWGALKGIDAEGCARMSELFRKWIGQKLDMQWLGGERLLTVLQDSSPTGVRDADPAYWQLRLDALRMTNRPDQFDETAIDYCVTYEVSPPSWERSVCTARVIGANQHSTLPPPMPAVTDVSTGFVESQSTADGSLAAIANFDLSGQLVGDIGPTLRKMDADLGDATIVNVSCVRLIRVDFIAAGDLLNWVLARRSENRLVTFLESHRLVALFFGAMGINEHAKVKVRTV
ncbi:MAG: hypothetical protein AD742_03315 [Methylibium sp. NZG]|nr:MAG: hypothetical protein AD742_03315 [Methylibium sp. NZG]